MLKSQMTNRKGSFRRLISFSELIGDYVGIRSRAPVMSCNKDLIWLEIPIVTENQGNDYNIKKNYTNSRPTYSALRELAVRNLINNLAVTPRHFQGNSGMWA